MMPPSLQSALLVIQCLGLAVVLALLGAVWARLRASPMAETARLVRELAQRQRELESVLARIEPGRGGPEAEPSGPKPSSFSRASKPKRRFDPAAPSAVTGPTLIAVPNLSSPQAGASAAAAAELARRFGAIWALADSGAPAEAIAQATGQPIGQVELILGLRRQLAAHASAATTTLPRSRA